MSDLFQATRSRKMTGGAFTVTMKNGAAIAKRLQKLENNGKTAIRRTVSDFSTRAPAWVSKGIRQHYGVDTKAINDAGPNKKRGGNSVKVAGRTIDGVRLVYEGRLLTPTHFKQSPKTRPGNLQNKKINVPGTFIKVQTGSGKAPLISPPKKYKVKATIIKGQRVSLPPGTFIAEGNGGVSLPFQRVGPHRKNIEAVRTLSVPQMIDGRAHDTIEGMVSEKLEDRFEHHIKQAMK